MKLIALMMLICLSAFAGMWKRGETVMDLPDGGAWAAKGFVRVHPVTNAAHVVSVPLPEDAVQMLALFDALMTRNFGADWHAQSLSMAQAVAYFLALPAPTLEQTADSAKLKTLYDVLSERFGANTDSWPFGKTTVEQVVPETVTWEEDR